MTIVFRPFYPPHPPRYFGDFFGFSPSETLFSPRKTGGSTKYQDYFHKVLAVPTLPVNNARVKQSQWTGTREATGGLEASRGSLPGRLLPDTAWHFRLKRELNIPANNQSQAKRVANEKQTLAVQYDCQCIGNQWRLHPPDATLIPVVVGATTTLPFSLRDLAAAPNGKNFYNLEGYDCGRCRTPNASSFGVIDFSFAGITLPATPSNIAGATLNLTESNSTFSAAGPVSVYLASTAANAVSIESTNTTLNYVGTNNGLASVDSDLGTLTLLGSGTFTNTGTGNPDLYSLSFTGSALTQLISTLTAKGTLRLVMTPDAATTAATWAGFSTTTAGTSGPSLGFFAVVPVPEPTSLTLLGLGGLLLVGRRVIRKK